MRPARLARRAARLVGIDGNALLPHARGLFVTPSRLGIILMIAGANSAFWVSAIALVSVAAGIELNSGLLAGLGLVVMVLSIIGLAITTADRR